MFKRGGLYVDPELCEWAWRAFREQARTAGSNGVRLRPEFQELIDNARQAASDHLSQVPMSVAGHESRTSADIERPLTMTTEAMGTELRVGERQARRIAKEQGIEPIAKDSWLRTDVATLVARRRRK